MLENVVEKHMSVDEVRKFLQDHAETKYAVWTDVALGGYIPVGKTVLDKYLRTCAGEVTTTVYVVDSTLCIGGPRLGVGVC
jgi:hypothetical protein